MINPIAIYWLSISHEWCIKQSHMHSCFYITWFQQGIDLNQWFLFTISKLISSFLFFFNCSSIFPLSSKSCFWESEWLTMACGLEQLLTLLLFCVLFSVCYQFSWSNDHNHTQCTFPVLSLCAHHIEAWHPNLYLWSWIWRLVVGVAIATPDLDMKCHIVSAVIVY